MRNATELNHHVQQRTAASTAWHPVNGSSKPPSECINLDERAGAISVHDPRVFHPDHRGLCRQILAQVASHAMVRFADIDLTTSTCAFQFDPGQDASVMATAFTGAIHAALAPTPRGRHAGRIWEMMTVFRDNGIITSWESHLLATGRLELRASDHAGDRRELLAVADRLVELAGVSSCRVGRWPPRLIIDFDPASVTPHQLHVSAHGAWFEQHPVPRVQPEVTPAERFLVPPGIRRTAYWVLAGGSFTLTLSGIIVPGIPTVPFLLVTGYALARCSPHLHDILARTRFFGPILREWETQRGLSTGSKSKALAMTTSVMALSIALDPFDPIALGLTAVFTSIFYLSVSARRRPDQLRASDPRPALSISPAPVS